MNNKTDIFDFLRSCTQFLKVVVLFFLTFHMLYWAEHLLMAQWTWMNFARPILDLCLGLGACVSNKSINALGAVFEYKYAITICIYVIAYLVIKVLNMIINEIEYHVKNITMRSNKVKEVSFNNRLMNEQAKKETVIKQYKIFVKTSIKDKFMNEDFNYNLEEQNQIMNEFLIKKTGVQPGNLEGGFLYSFNDFDQIDNVLEVFFKLIKSTAPLDYVINVQVVSYNNYLDKIQLLSGLKIKNKITMLAETAYRYRFNQSRKYRTVQLGLYQKVPHDIEVCEFVEY